MKLAGLGQRLVDGAAHVGGVVVASDSARIRAVLEPVYEALELDWDPATAGSVQDEVSGASADSVADAIQAVLSERYEIVKGELDSSTLALAESFVSKHAVAV